MDADLKRAWFAAANGGDRDGLQRMLAEHPELLNLCDRHQHTLKASAALHLCVWGNRWDLAAFLLDKGANLEQRDEAGMTPLQIDLVRVSMERMRPMPLLRSRCIDVSSPVALAVFKRKLVRDRSTYHEIDTTTMEMLLSRGANVNSVTDAGETTLQLAVEDGLIKHTEILLRFGGDPHYTDPKGRNVLDIAGERGYSDIVALLLAHDLTLVDLAGKASLRAAVCHDFVATVAILFDLVQDRTSSEDEKHKFGSELLLLAVEYDAPDCLAFLLTRDPPLNEFNADGKTAVHIACSASRAPLLQMLLLHGARHDLRSPVTGYTAFHFAVQYHCRREIQVLVQFGADINAFNSEMQCPLVFGLKRRTYIEDLVALVECGARFRFPTRASRDDMVRDLTTELHDLSPSTAPKLLERLLNARCIEQDNCRAVISSLLWSKHLEEAIQLLLLSVMSAAQASREEALAVLLRYTQEHNGSIVTQQLLTDLLRW